MGKTVTNPNRAARKVALFCVALAAVLALQYARRMSDTGSAPIPAQELTQDKTHAPPAPAQPQDRPAAALELLTIDTRSGPKTFNIEVARTTEQQALGLMFRTHLADDQGMLFPHDDVRDVSMWMSNTFIPLDMLFIRADGVIHRIEANTEPMSERIILSNGPVGGVLEIAGGAAARLGIAAGDRVRHAQFKPAE